MRVPKYIEEKIIHHKTLPEELKYSHPETSKEESNREVSGIQYGTWEQDATFKVGGINGLVCTLSRPIEVVSETNLTPQENKWLKWRIKITYSDIAGSVRRLKTSTDFCLHNTRCFPAFKKHFESLGFTVKGRRQGLINGDFADFVTVSWENPK